MKSHSEVLKNIAWFGESLVVALYYSSSTAHTSTSHNAGTRLSPSGCFSLLTSSKRSDMWIHSACAHIAMAEACDLRLESHASATHGMRHVTNHAFTTTTPKWHVKQLSIVCLPLDLSSPSVPPCQARAPELSSPVPMQCSGPATNNQAASSM
jgi:hypothetical protein